MIILPLPKELSCSFHVIKRESNQGMSGFYFERKKTPSLTFEKSTSPWTTECTETMACSSSSQAGHDASAGKIKDTRYLNW